MINQTQVVSDLLEMEAELMAQQVHVGFVGMMKVGKSATLNALLRKRFLPSAVQAETAIEVTITHDIHSPDGVLYIERFTNATEELAKGVPNILNNLEDINKKKRSKQNEYKKVWLNISIPFLSKLTKKFSLTISDTPGSDEAVLESLGLESSIQQLAAFVIVLDYRKMKSDAEISLLKNLTLQHPTIFNTPERLLFILNHMNSYDEHRAFKIEKSIRPREAPKFVAEYLQELLQVKISSDQVIPYSAYWALESRICLDNPDHVDDSIIEEARIILRNQGQSDSADGESNDNIAMCKKLEKYSNILDIENRLVKLFVDYGHKVIDRNVAEKAMHDFTTLRSVINMMLNKLELPKINQTVLHQRHVIAAMKKIKDDVPTGLKNTLDMLHTSAVANLSHYWTATVANATDKVLDDLDTVVSQSYNAIINTFQTAMIQFFKTLREKVKQSFNDIVQHYRDVVLLQFQTHMMKVQEDLSYVSENESVSFPLQNTSAFNLALPVRFQCQNLSLQNINITGKCVIELKVNITQRSTSWFCSFITCADIVNTVTIYVVKSSTLKDGIMKLKCLHGCYDMLKIQVTEYFVSASSSATKELINSVDEWWKRQELKHNANLLYYEANLEDAIKRRTELDEIKSNLEGALQNVIQVLNNAA